MVERVGGVTEGRRGEKGSLVEMKCSRTRHYDDDEPHIDGSVNRSVSRVGSPPIPTGQ